MHATSKSQFRKSQKRVVNFNCCCLWLRSQLVLKVRFDKVIWESPKIWRKMVRDLLSKAIIIQFWYQKMAKTVSKKHEQYQNTFLNKYWYDWVYLIAKIAQIKQNHWNSSWNGLESTSKFLGFPNWLYQTRPLVGHKIFDFS